MLLLLLRVTAVIGHSLGMATALNLASSTDLCQSVVSLSGIGLQPHRLLVAPLLNFISLFREMEIIRLTQLSIYIKDLCAYKPL